MSFDKRKLIDLNSVNAQIRENPKAVICSAEESFDEQIKRLADVIAETPSEHKVIMLSGTSASGKTTTALKLTDMLRGVISTHTISIDDFWLNREEVPLLPDGRQDYESINILNIPMLSGCIRALVNGNEASMPRFDFKTYRSMPDSYTLKLGKNDIVIIEGIQALNDVVLSQIADKRVKTLYADVRSNFLLDGSIAFEWRDLRFLRRMVRDDRFRHYPPSGTITMWDGVIEAEEKYTVPFAGSADMIIDTGYTYELNGLKKYAMPLLETIFDTDYGDYAAYSKKLYNNLSLLEDIDEADIPSTSITREFIGGCSYYKNKK